MSTSYMYWNNIMSFKGAYYTLLMVDPDAPFPENPFLKYWLHWMVVDITVCNTES